MVTIQIIHTAFEAVSRHVASLTSVEPIESALEEAFVGTQNIDTSWVETRGQRGVSVEPTEDVLTQGSCRSTSVGDYVRIIDEQGEESFFRCCSSGWNPITDRSELSKTGSEVMIAAYVS